LRNNLGKEIKWEYRSSTHFYLEDKKAGKPWVTRLPFPVQVVSSTVVTDQWRQSRFANSYAYHHGYYDHSEREFRGFGRVEQIDIQSFGTFAEGNIASPYISPDKTLYQPPIKTVSWFHTGAFLGRERILNQFEEEYFQPNGGGFQENILPAPDLEAQNLSTTEWREALRACKGMALRIEVYECDVDSLELGMQVPVKLFSTAFHNCHIQRLQPKGNNLQAVFLTTESEAITYNYELDLRTETLSPDPRIAHNLNLKTDEYGNLLESVAVAYPRVGQHVEADLPPGAENLIHDVQRELHIAFVTSRFTNDVNDQANYRLRLPCEVKTYELTGLSLQQGHYFTMAELRDAGLALTVDEIPYHSLPIQGSIQKRQVEHVRNLFFQTNLAEPESLGTLNVLGLPYEAYKLALTEGLLDAVFPAGKLTQEVRAGLADSTVSGYLSGALLATSFPLEDTTGQYWIRSGIAGYEDDAHQHFYLPERCIDPFGQETRFQFEDKDLFLRGSIDSVGNEVKINRFDFRVLAPLEMEDINLNLSEVVYDILGTPAAMALKGKGDEADNLGGIIVEPDLDTLIAFFTGDYDESISRALLGNATARHLYYFGELSGPGGHISYGHHPACAAGLLREIHLAQGGENTPLQAGFEYADGTGAIIVTKAQAEPENGNTHLRWIANGKTVLNNKGNPVKQYEPYFSPSAHHFEEPQETGVTPILYYDSAGRLIRTEMPDGVYSRVEFSPWYTAAYDANDTVLEPGNAWFQRNNNGTGEEHRAAQLATVHANTPAMTHTDSLGRETIAITHNRWSRDGSITEEKTLTYTKLDTEGKPLWILDARGNRVMQYIFPYKPDDIAEDLWAVPYAPCYDVSGNLLFQHGMDGGDRWILPDATGQPMYNWDINETQPTNGEVVEEHRLHNNRYDLLHRPFEQRLRINVGQWMVTERFIYGEGQPDDQGRNLRGQPYQHDDGSGRMILELVDFKGQPLEVKRQLTADYQAHVLDWLSAPDLMEENFTQVTQYDALGRMRRLENWHLEGRHPAVYLPHYNQRGLLLSETITVNGQVQEAIRNIRYDEKGQRILIRYGNNTVTRYHYDPLTFRLRQSRTTKNTGAALPTAPTNLTDQNQLQNLYYSYDPSGNITEIQDDAYEPVFFNNQQVDARSRYNYDALYRLIEASGRENAQVQGSPGQFDVLQVQSFPITEQALRNYTQRYSYDAVGNILEMQHLANGGGWTRNYAYAATNNRLLRTWIGNNENEAEIYDYDTHGSMLNLNNAPEQYQLRWDYTGI
jgi:hypothetical protein